MHLEFYPGQHLLAVIESGKVIARYEAYGGPPTIGTDPNMPEEPTTAGMYVIDQAHPYRTPTWPLSSIKWGTPLRDMPGKPDVWYQVRGGQWASVGKDHGISRQDIVDLHKDLYGTATVPSTWIFNDFGPLAIRWFKDLNGNRKLDGSERLSGQMFHTTPENEAQHALGKPVLLGPSHGCIHLTPADRNRLFHQGAFKPKTVFIVHRYHERLP